MAGAEQVIHFNPHRAALVRAYARAGHHFVAVAVKDNWGPGVGHHHESLSIGKVVEIRDLLTGFGGAPGESGTIRAGHQSDCCRGKCGACKHATARGKIAHRPIVPFNLYFVTLYSWLVYLLYWAVSLPLFAVEAYALIDALSRPPQRFEAEMKRTKIFWLAVLLIAALFGLGAIPLWGNPSAFFMMLAVIPAGVYLADVRPALIGRRW